MIAVLFLVLLLGLLFFAAASGGPALPMAEILGLVGASVPETPSDAAFQEIRISRGEHVLPPAAAEA